MGSPRNRMPYTERFGCPFRRYLGPAEEDLAFTHFDLISFAAISGPACRDDEKKTSWRD